MQSRFTWLLRKNIVTGKEVQMIAIKIYQDVHTAFAQANAPLKRDVAIAMGMRPETFSNHIRHRDARVTSAWAKRFNEAWDEAATNGE